jgi:hypothetical protein
MKKLILFLFFISVSLMSFAKEPVEGRWDITINKAPGKTSPSWLEITHSGIRTLTGHFVGEGGSARPVSKINFKDNKISFQIPPQWEDADQDLKVEGTYANDQLAGTLTTPKGEVFSWVGVRAPSLWREKAPVWGKPIELFNGKDLTGWEAINKKNQWIVENGVLKSPKSGANLRTKDTYNDFKLHIEFRYPKESNSGIYLRGRYELQVSDSQGMEVAKDQLGAIYGFILPLENIAKAAGEWQSFDITLVGRLVTVIGNGKQIIYTQSIPGITGGAMDSNEGEPGPIMIQGDHGPVEYRNIVLTPAL